MTSSAPLALLRSVCTDELDYYALRSHHARGPSQPPPWCPLPCVSRRAVGFDSPTTAIGAAAADNVLNALHLEARLADDAPALSYLKIRLGGGAPLGPRPGILAADDNLIILESSLPDPSRLSIYLVYDAAAKSISMIPSHPWSQHCDPLSPAWHELPSALASSVLVVGNHTSYALVSMGERIIYSHDYCDGYKVQDVLYLWRSTSPRWDLVTVMAGFPAEFKGENVGHAYVAVVAFSCAGRAFWANLVCGVMYCSCDDLLLSASNGGAELEFGFIRLPVDLPRNLPCHVLVGMELRANMYRTMGRVGDPAIKFVAIDPWLLRDARLPGLHGNGLDPLPR
ncbi:hypothetical protein ACQ4PT_004871 [Festuca glaucescens]